MTKRDAIREFRETGLNKDDWPSFIFSLALCKWITWDQYAHWGRI